MMILSKKVDKFNNQVVQYVDCLQYGFSGIAMFGIFSRKFMLTVASMK